MRKRFDRLIGALKVGPRLAIGFALIVGQGMAVIALLGPQTLNGNLRFGSTWRVQTSASFADPPSRS